MIISLGVEGKNSGVLTSNCQEMIYIYKEREREREKMIYEFLPLFYKESYYNSNGIDWFFS